ncbi:MAG TPA: PAS domain-containing protein [Acidimicrobiales bacterium]
MSNATEGQPGSGHLLGAIFSATADAVVVIDASGTVVLSNPAVSEQREPSRTIIEWIVPL